MILNIKLPPFFWIKYIHEAILQIRSVILLSFQFTLLSNIAILDTFFSSI
jgi:hypothetical protein